MTGPGDANSLFQAVLSPAERTRQGGGQRPQARSSGGTEPARDAEVPSTATPTAWGMTPSENSLSRAGLRFPSGRSGIASTARNRSAMEECVANRAGFVSASKSAVIAVLD